MKKFVFVLIGLIGIAGAGLLYVLPMQSEDASVGETLGALEQASGEIMVPLTTTRSLSPVLSFDGQKIWFFSQDGRLFRAKLLGNIVVEEFPLPSEISNLYQVYWQGQGSDFIAVYLLGGHKRYKFYDSAEDRFFDLADGVREPRFTQNDAKIVYDWVRGDNKHELKVSDPNGENFKKIGDLFEPDYRIAAASDSTKVVLYTKDSPDPSSVILADIGTQLFESWGDRKNYSEVVFSPDGTSLFLVSNDLEILDFATREVKNLGPVGHMKSWTWHADGKSIYYISQDQVVRQDLVTLDKQVVFENPELYKMQVRDLVVHPDLPYVFFVDEISGFLYRIKIKPASNLSTP